MTSSIPSPEPRPVDRVGGVVLCGGQSRRMGRDKAWLPIGNEVFLQRVVRCLSEVVSPIVVVGAAGQDLPPMPETVTRAVDERPDRGPLQGLVAGLERLPADVDAVYLTACDAPLLNPAFVRRTIELLGGHDIVVPESDGQPHPLAGVYRVCVRDAARRLLAGVRLRMMSLFEACRTRQVPAEAFRDVDPDLGTLRNVNTPADYDSLLRDLLAEDCPRSGQA